MAPRSARVPFTPSPRRPTRLAAIPLALLAVTGCTPGSDRWYTAEQVEQGEAVYVQHCQACHGVRATGSPTWQRPDSTGHYPPPPLDGTAHTWHHSLELLVRTIDEGGAAFRGVMPPFNGVLDAEEQLAAVAYIQSLWPADVYAKWIINDQASR